MKNRTHYLFSLGLTSGYVMFIVDGGFYAWLIMLLSLLTNFFSIAPNFIDQYLGAQFKNEGVILTRNRHPLTHSPWTVLYYLPLLYLAQKSQFSILNMIISLFIISWSSHLFLDSLNPGGLPLGRQSIFSNHPIKHYKFHLSYPQRTRRLCLARIPFNDPRVNQKLERSGLFLFSLNCASLFLSLFRS